MKTLNNIILLHISFLQLSTKFYNDNLKILVMTMPRLSCAAKAALSRMFAVPTHVCRRHNCKHTNMSHPFNIQQSEINTWVSCNTKMFVKTIESKELKKQILVILYPGFAWPWPHRAGPDYQDSHTALAGIFDEKSF